LDVVLGNNRQRYRRRGGHDRASVRLFDRAIRHLVGHCSERVSTLSATHDALIVYKFDPILAGLIYGEGSLVRVGEAEFAQVGRESKRTALARLDAQLGGS